MIEHLDEEMRKRKVEAICVLGDTTLANPDLTYVVGGSLPRGGVYFKRARSDSLLVTNNLDLGLAKKYGRVKRIETFTDRGFEKLAAKHGRTKALPLFIASVLREKGVKGSVVVFGRNDLATGVNLVDELRRVGVRARGESSPTILEVARETKRSEEIEEIRCVGRKTAAIVDEVVEALRNLKRKRGHLQLGRQRATVGLFKTLISSRFASQELIAPEGTIFATGPSSAEGHNMGVSADEIREGRLIVFDLFPQAETGYWFDLTRSFIVGRADSKARRLYDTVREAQEASLDFLREGVTGEEAMSRACGVIERAGFRTLREIYQGRAKSIGSGFNHSLGHGVGLTIGERPYLSFLSKDRLKRREVVTVEPGVYLRGYGGVRIEDTVAITHKGVDNLGRVSNEFELA